MYITISRCGTCFGMVGHVQQSVSSVRMVKSTLKEFKEVSKVSNTAPKVRIWSFLKTAMHFFVSLAAATLFRTHRFRHRLHGVVVAFWLSVFASVFVPVFQLFLTCSHHNFHITTMSCYSAENDKLSEVYIIFANNYCIPKVG